MKTSTFLQKKDTLVFTASWLILFILYFRTAQAGFTADYTGWLQNLQNDSFTDYLNRKHHSSKSLYQFTQLCTYIFYKIWGTSAWMWHLLHITLHAVNCLLLYKLFSNLLSAFNINSTLPAIGACLLFSVNPHITEVIVWEPAYHFITGYMAILAILLLVQKYQLKQKFIYAAAAGFIFILSAFSLEIFYLTPFFTLSLCIFYYAGINKNKSVFKKSLLLFLLPQTLILCIYFILLKLLYNESVAHINSQVFQQELVVYLSKMPKYLFHALLFGRFWPDEWRSQVYYWWSLPRYLFIFYGILLLFTDYVFFRFKQMEAKQKIISLLFFWILFCFALLSPIWFQDIMLSVCDRYMYIVLPPLYFSVFLIISYIPSRWFLITVLAFYATANIYFNNILIRYWQQSASLLNHMMDTLPGDDGRIKIFLNQPQSIKGIAMMTIGDGSEIKLMNNLLRDKKLIDTCYDAAAFNMNAVSDGANARFLNDSTVKVTLNQWGGWWWYGNIGMNNYENKHYSIHVIDGSHEYDLTLKQPRDKYTLYYLDKGEWQIVK